MQQIPESGDAGIVAGVATTGNESSNDDALNNRVVPSPAWLQIPAQLQRRLLGFLGVPEDVRERMVGLCLRNARTLY
jgi:hypothetical protein